MKLLKSSIITSLFIYVSSYQMVPHLMSSKKTIYFFPASLKNSVPQELYHGFLDNLKVNYNVEVPLNEAEFIKKNNNSSDEILLLSHSSGANQLMNIYKKLPQVNKKAFMIDPLDFEKYTLPSFEMPRKLSIDLDEIDNSIKSVLEKDYVEELKSYVWNSKDSPINENNDNKDKILILNHKRSAKWNMFPIVPPIYSFKMELKDLPNTTIVEENIDEFSHFDLLDRPWANRLNKITSNTNDVNIDKYYEQIIPTIHSFYNN